MQDDKKKRQDHGDLRKSQAQAETGLNKQASMYTSKLANRKCV